MKTNLIVLLAATGLLSNATAAAQNTVGITQVQNPSYLASPNDYVPAMFTKDGQSLLSYEYHTYPSDGAYANITVLNGDLQQVTSFETPHVGATGFSAEHDDVRIHVKWENVVRTYIPEYNGMPLEPDYLSEYMKYYLPNEFGYNVHGAITYSDNGVEREIWIGDESYYYEPENETLQVLKWYFLYTPAQNGEKASLVEVKCSGTPTINIDYNTPTNIYGLSSEQAILPFRICDYQSGHSAFGNIAVTQTLFNDDEAFEYIFPVYSSKEGYNKFGNITILTPDEYKATYNVVGFTHITGFCIVNENREELQRILFDEGFEAVGTDCMTLILIGGKKYLSCHARAENTDYTLLYEIGGNNSGITQAAAPMRTRVYPTLVRPDENVCVDIESTAEATVNVVNSTGILRHSARIKAGQGTLNIPASKMSAGMNIVTIQSEKQSPQSTKIIVK